MGNRTIKVGRDISGSSAVTGDHNVAQSVIISQDLPQAEAVNIRAEITALREALAALDTPDKRKIQRAMDDAADETTKAAPDRNEIGGALERAIKYARQANAFADQAGKLKPHLEAACGWLGQNWHKLLAAAGLAL